MTIQNRQYMNMVRGLNTEQINEHDTGQSHGHWRPKRTIWEWLKRQILGYEGYEDDLRFTEAVLAYCNNCECCSDEEVDNLLSHIRHLKKRIRQEENPPVELSPPPLPPPPMKPGWGGGGYEGNPRWYPQSGGGGNQHSV